MSQARCPWFDHGLRRNRHEPRCGVEFTSKDGVDNGHEQRQVFRSLKTEELAHEDEVIRLRLHRK